MNKRSTLVWWNIFVFSLRYGWLPRVLLEPSVLSRVVQPRHFRQHGDLWHDGTHCRVVLRSRPNVQDDRRPLRLDTYRHVIRQRHYFDLLVWSEAFRWGVQQRQKLHVHVAQTWLRPDRRTAGRYSAASASTHKRLFRLFTARLILIFSARPHANTCIAWYCYKNSVRLSIIHCHSCVETSRLVAHWLIRTITCH